MIEDPDLLIGDRGDEAGNGGTGAELLDEAAVAEPAESSLSDAPAGAPGRQMAVSLLFPGGAMLRRSPVWGSALLLAGLLVPIALLVWLYVNRDDLIGFALDQRLLTIVAVVSLLVVLTRAIAIAEIARRYWHAPAIRWKTSIAAAVVALLAIPTFAVAYQANETRATVGEVFSSGDDEALFEPVVTERFRPAPLDDEADDESSVGPVDEAGDDGASVDDPVGDGVTGEDAVDESADDAGAESELPGVADDGARGRAVDEALAIDPEAVHTTLLLGSDAGPNRWGSRTDTMMLFSVHEASGRTALISIPRNLTRLHFPPGTPLGDKFPNGFNDLANAVFTHVTIRDELVEAYGADGQRPEVVALAQGLGYSLDVRIDDFVLVNMQGFLDIIDAVGGVTIDVPKKVLLQRFNPTREYDLPDSVGPGIVEMDGTLAIAYARARRGDSDYQRMGRQRQLLAALGSQVSTAEAVAAFPKVSDVLGDSMRTSLSAGEFSDLLDQLGENASIGESVGLTPPLISTSRPDYAQIQSIIDAVEHYVLTGEASGYAG